MLVVVKLTGFEPRPCAFEIGFHGNQLWVDSFSFFGHLISKKVRSGQEDDRNPMERFMIATAKRLSQFLIDDVISIFNFPILFIISYHFNCLSFLEKSY